MIAAPRYEPARQCAISMGSRRLSWVRYTPPQRAFLEDDAPIALLRGGNQIGKTLAIHADLIHTARGTHPFQATPKPPVNIVVLSESWDQMGQAGGFMEKLWALLPKNEIDPKVTLEKGRGITGKPPRVVFVDGPGKGSVISFGTYRQGAGRVAGGTVHRVYMDEPPPESIFSELRMRVLRLGGKVRIGFTPVIDMPDQRWLRMLVEAGEIREHNPWLREANCWPAGNPGPWLSQEMIDAVIRTIPEAHRAMRVEGSWQPVLTDNWLSNFDRARHVREVPPPPGAHIGLGIDHGTNAGKQAAALTAYQDRLALRPYVFVVDEDIGDGMTSTMQDAHAIHAMLGRHNWGWRDVDTWVGDRPTGENRYLVKKSNNQLRKHLAYQAGVAEREFPKIATPHKWHGSVEHGLGMMNALMGDFDADGTPHFSVHPRCERFIEFCERFAGARDDPLKDIGDGVRYTIERVIKDLPGMHLVALY